MHYSSTHKCIMSVYHVCCITRTVIWRWCAQRFPLQSKSEYHPFVIQEHSQKGHYVSFILGLLLLVTFVLMVLGTMVIVSLGINIFRQPVWKASWRQKDWSEHQYMQKSVCVCTLCVYTVHVCVLICVMKQFQLWCTSTDFSCMRKTGVSHLYSVVWYWLMSTGAWMRVYKFIAVFWLA